MSGWVYEHREGDQNAGSYGPDVRTDSEAARPSVYAYGGHVGHGCRVRECYHYPGSWPPAFGMVSDEAREAYVRHTARWPHLTVDVSFPAGRTDLRTALSRQLQSVIDLFLAEHGLEPPTAPEPETTIEETR